MMVDGVFGPSHQPTTTSHVGTQVFTCDLPPAFLENPMPCSPILILVALNFGCRGWILISVTRHCITPQTRLIFQEDKIQMMP